MDSATNRLYYCHDLGTDDVDGTVCREQCPTHVISAIMHIGHEYYDENEPWPIEIEDHDATEHSYEMKEGQMLFYESASCLHGRKRIFKGKYYASIFIHYKPVDRNIWDFSLNVRSSPLMHEMHLISS